MLSVYMTKKSAFLFPWRLQSTAESTLQFGYISAFEHTCSPSTGQLCFPGSSPCKMIQACILPEILYSVIIVLFCLMVIFMFVFLQQVKLTVLCNC